MRRRLALIGLIALVPAAALVGSLMMRNSPITQANCDLIRPGMTMSDVEKMFGGKGEDSSVLVLFADESVTVWQDGHRWIVVNFRAGVVREAYFCERTLLQRIQDWYHGRQWGPFSEAA